MPLHECLPNFRIPRGRAGQLLFGHSAVKTFLWSEFLQLLHPGYCDTNYCSCCILKRRSLSHCASVILPWDILPPNSVRQPSQPRTQAVKFQTLPLQGASLFFFPPSRLPN